MAGSVHDKLGRVRKPRVHITYDVETEGSIQQKELPFVVGVLGDFSGDPTSPLKPLKDRKFVEIDRDNFDNVLASMTPGLSLKVDNTLADDGSELAVNLQFKSMQDFNPINIVKQVDPLRKLFETREKLKELQTKADRSDELQELLEGVLQQTESLAQVAADLGIASRNPAAAVSSKPAASAPAPAPVVEPQVEAKSEMSVPDDGESIDSMLKDMGIDPA